MMRCRTCLDADQTGRQGRKELQHLRATYALADDRRASTIYPVNLEYRLRNIETNRANLAHGRLPIVVCVDATTLWHIDAAEWAPSTASFSIDPAGLASRFMSPSPPKADLLAGIVGEGPRAGDYL
jgi:hypothetical protein